MSESDHLKEFKEIMDAAHVEYKKSDEPKFTPGPLHVEYTGGRFFAIYDKIMRTVADFYWSATSKGEQEANANLYAAAPEMYKELEHLKNYFIQPEFRIVFDRIEDILRRARGESEATK